MSKSKQDDNQDIRWQQRFANYKKALSQLKNAVELLEEQSDIFSKVK